MKPKARPHLTVIPGGRSKGSFSPDPFGGLIFIACCAIFLIAVAACDIRSRLGG